MPTLALVPGEGHSRPAGIHHPSLSAQPFRPGELPAPLVLRLPAGTRRAAANAASAVQIPVSLWIRTAVDCSRHLHEVTRFAGSSAGLRETLDELAERAPVHSMGALARRRQWLYAQALRRGDPSAPRSVSASPLTVLLPDTSLAAWSQSAATCGLDLERWCEQLVQAAPERPHLWEAAAAEAGRSLGEWIYAMALRTSGGPEPGGRGPAVRPSQAGADPRSARRRRGSGRAREVVDEVLGQSG